MSDSTLRVAHVASNPAGLPIQAPPANLGLAMAEQLRRGDAAAASVAAAPTPTVTPAAALKEAYLAKNTGFFACHHANLAYPMRCMVPNERYIDWQPAASQSAEHVAAAHATLMRRVRAVVQRISAGGEAAPAFQPPVPAPGMEAFMSMDKAPEPVFVDGSAPAALVGADLHPDDQVIGDWPRDLERRAVFMNLAMVDDLDVPEDSPAHPGAAGMEPMMIPFGGVYETEEEAKDAAREEIAPWAAEFKVCTISMNGFLWATEVDPDKIKEQHRTGDAGGDAEMALVMGQNKTQKATAAKARLAAAAAEAPLRETNANAALPEVDEVSRRNQPAVTFAGEVQQFGRGGVAIGSADPSPAVAAAVAGIIDL